MPRKILRRTLAVICIAVISVWGAAIIRCEWLTSRYASSEVHEACVRNTMLYGIEKIKVLDRIGYGCLKLYVKTEDTGSVIVLTHDSGGNWQQTYWDTAWSKTGSADGFVWPYIR